MFEDLRILCRGQRRAFQCLSLAAPSLLALLALSSASSQAATLCVNPGGTSGCSSTISAAVTAAAPGDTIRVDQGIYREQVIITKSLSLVAMPNTLPSINAIGQANGIFINGMSAAPNPGVADVLISGLRVYNAKFEGILIANASGVTLYNNYVFSNNKALDIANHACPGIPAFETNEGDDCGEGIHLMGTTRSSLVHNDVFNNAGGILISDETGPSHNNLLSLNRVHDNSYDCGITMASHGPATSVIPTATVSYGVTNNTIDNNISARNGLQVPGAGAGVGIFAPFPGTTAAHNVVINNTLLNNGQPGVTMHNHAAAPAPAPPVNLNGNVIVGNHISGNAADAEDATTPGTAGINIFSLAPVVGTVISQNVIENEAVAVVFNTQGGALNAHFNNFNITGIGIDNMGTGRVDATENWWHCAAGPGNGSCTTVSGTGVDSTPWLTAPFTPSLF